MPMSLTYLDDLSRVRIEVTGIDPGTYRIERSINQMFWETVRGGREIVSFDGTLTLDDYEFAADVENFYRLIAGEATVGLHLPGGNGNYASAPDAAPLDIVGDLDLRAYLRPNQWVNPGTNQIILAKWHATGDQRSYALMLFETGQLRLYWSPDGTGLTDNGQFRAATVPISFFEESLAVRATLQVDVGGNHVVTFYTADDLNSSWQQLGNTVTTGGTTSIYAGTAELSVGAWVGGTQNVLNGVVFGAQVYNGVNGTLVANPDFTTHPTGTTSFTDSESNDWTVNGIAEIVGSTLEEDSITPDLDGEVWLKSIRWPFLNRVLNCTNWEAVNRTFRGGIFPIQGRSVPVAVIDRKGSREFSLVVSVEGLEASRDMDLILAANDVMFIHTPREDPEDCGPMSDIPGGYVTTGSPMKYRPYAGSQTTIWDLQCVEVAAPGVDVIGGTMTYGALLNFFDTYANMLSANSTYYDLLELMASPDDLVVL